MTDWKTGILVVGAVYLLTGIAASQPGYFQPSSDATFIDELQSAYSWPVTPMGMCYEGVTVVGNGYQERGYNVQYALNRDMSHTWLLVQDSRGYYAAVDSYRGYVSINQCHEYYTPYYSFSSFSEMSEALPRWAV